MPPSYHHWKGEGHTFPNIPKLHAVYMHIFWLIGTPFYSNRYGTFVKKISSMSTIVAFTQSKDYLLQSQFSPRHSIYTAMSLKPIAASCFPTRQFENKLNKINIFTPVQYRKFAYLMSPIVTLVMSLSVTLVRPLTVRLVANTSPNFSASLAHRNAAFLYCKYNTSLYKQESRNLILWEEEEFCVELCNRNVRS